MGNNIGHKKEGNAERGKETTQLPKSQKKYTMEERKAKKMEELVNRFGRLLKPKYEKAQVLSTAGGFSTVIKALNTGLDREEAIKAIDLDAVVEEGLTMEKVMQEVTMLAKLDHNNIVKVYNKLRRNDDKFDYLFVIMELCTSTLVDTLKAHSNGVPIKEARNILSQIVDGVAYLHSKLIIHRDLKPANVFIKEGIIKIGDFNISKEIGKGDMTRASQMLVTIHYCPPERAIHRQPGDYRVDLWSIGVIYFQLLHGIRPFNGATVEDLCHNIEFIKYPPITKGDDFDRKVIQMCLVNEKDRCYITDLQNFIKDTPKACYIYIYIYIYIIGATHGKD